MKRAKMPKITNRGLKKLEFLKSESGLIQQV